MAALVFNMKRDPENELQPINASSVDAAESSEDSAAHGSSRAGASSSDYHKPRLHDDRDEGAPGLRLP